MTPETPAAKPAARPAEPVTNRNVGRNIRLLDDLFLEAVREAQAHVPIRQVISGGEVEGQRQVRSLLSRQWRTQEADQSQGRDNSAVTVIDKIQQQPAEKYHRGGDGNIGDMPFDRQSLNAVNRPRTR